MDSNVNVTHQGNQLNNQHAGTNHKRSTFPLGYTLYNTPRFGELTPYFVMQGLPADFVKLRSSHGLRTYTLSAPLQSPIRMNKDNFLVPMPAILPLNWEKIYTQPNIGNDVPEDAYTCVSHFRYKMLSYFYQRIQGVKPLLDPADQFVNIKDAVIRVLQFIVSAEAIYSNGSLLNVMGANMSSLFEYIEHEVGSTNERGRYDYDYFFDKIIRILETHLLGFILGRVRSESSADAYRKVIFSYDPATEVLPARLYGEDALPIRRFLEILRDDPSNLANIGSQCEIFFREGHNEMQMKGELLDLFNDIHLKDVNPDDENDKMDLSPLFAYQLTAAHFYTNDRIDYVYSADLWRQNLRQLVYPNATSDGPKTFRYNGIVTEYDYTSAAYFDRCFDAANPVHALEYLGYVFSFRHSLRFSDYFTGSRTRPLAVGDTSVDVNPQGQIDVVDVTRHIQMQRFLNAVNRTGRKISNYIGELFGTSVPQDYHNPLYLSHTADVLETRETQNTGEAQMENQLSVTATLGAGSSAYEFEVGVDIPCVLLGLAWFDIRRAYTKSVDRAFFHADRYDMFNPYLENIGDQAVLSREIDSSSADTDGIFGYQGRYMEYKQRSNRAVGGYVNNLPGYAFIADVDKGLPLPTHIRPDYIRSSNIELDRFYVSLTGYSLGSYFHFITRFDNDVIATREMQYNPQIL